MVITSIMVGDAEAAPARVMRVITTAMKEEGIEEIGSLETTTTRTRSSYSVSFLRFLEKLWSGRLRSLSSLLGS